MGKVDAVESHQTLMNDASQTTDSMTAQWAAWQKMWTDTATRMMQLSMTASPEGPPPDFLRQVRGGILQALTQSWEEFLRSPQFLDGMKQWMESAMAFRKMSNEFLAKARHETQTTAREDIDTIMLTVRHMETRILDRVEDLTRQMQSLNERMEALSGGKAATSSQPEEAEGASSTAKRRRA